MPFNAWNENREHPDGAMDPTCEQSDLLACMHVTRRFHAVAADLHVPGMAGLRGQRAAFVKPHRPKPLVDAHTFHWIGDFLH